MTPEIKKTTVYAKIDVADELPTEERDFMISRNNGLTYPHVSFFNGASFDAQRPITHWLKPSEGYFFTPQDLLSLKRKWAGEAWDVADPVKRVFEDLMHRGQSEVIHMAKETYLNNLKIDG